MQSVLLAHEVTHTCTCNGQWLIKHFELNLTNRYFYFFKPDFFGMNADTNGQVTVRTFKISNVQKSLQRTSLEGHKRKICKSTKGAFMYAGIGLFVFANDRTELIKL